MTSRTVVVTGASDGIGAAGARRLRADGHRVVVVGRSPDKVRAVARELDSPWFVADYARLDDVRRLAAELDAACPRVDVLVNNAGGGFGPRTRTVDGHERTMQVNHLAPFLLTNLLLPKLIASRAAVVQTASAGARMFGKLDLDDLDNDRHYTRRKAYGDSKLANLLFTRELHARYGGQGLSAAAFDPRTAATGFASDSRNLLRPVFGRPPLRWLLGTAEKAAGQLVWLAEGVPGRDWQSGVYYSRRRPARWVPPQLRDDALARGLWERSAARVGLA
ncbi:NAD(P)-dependent dehydrogenase (short-subunit alcohol dehydrogenase family) [Amycolatopsis bartoniae]|uniref:SDR family NAD(P)-dependent oxidoreductase n=1 Tax=Amycolatopsis bartoniae TaxID=941986 RepID=UPI00119257B0|nr:SDR family NAD(P)-dependent oxidoreductase [Amycolatopsis bartoniae]MBB2937750.1 NAD(P)-dependent dehydrogenase (short-subunit alcohol dehydrogenase family) [Amycolatopsis bartoniae]TVT08170.1 SDR family NAD(P)-dependent oxidoreductase [Amycolatopsis bartoniae]